MRTTDPHGVEKLHHSAGRHHPRQRQECRRTRARAAAAVTHRSTDHEVSSHRGRSRVAVNSYEMGRQSLQQAAAPLLTARSVSVEPVEKDAVFDVGEPGAPVNSLELEGRHRC